MSEPWEANWRDYYAILEVAEDAAPADINAAFRARARTSHPDLLAGRPEAERAEAEVQFKLLSEAYEVLRDPDRRAAYDRVRAEGGPPPPAPIILLHPHETVARTFDGVFSVRTVLSGPDADASLDVEVSCDDLGVELNAIDVRTKRARDGSKEVSVHVRGRAIDSTVDRIELHYQVGAVRLKQVVKLRASPLAILSLSNLPSTVNILASRFAVFGIAALVLAWVADIFVPVLVVPLAILAAGGLVGAVTLGAVGFVISPGRLARLKPRGGAWGVIPFIIIMTVVVRVIALLF